MNYKNPKADVKILLGDEELFMREIVTNALTAGGYRDILIASNFDLVRETVAANLPDMLILNGEMEQGRAIDMVTRIRHFREGSNPFVPIIMTTWHSDRDFIRKVVECGVDVLLTKPLAAGDLLARIDYLINTRPPFVATATYIGPDRRSRERDDGFPKFDVPNTLKDRAEGRAVDLRDLQQNIAKTFAKVRHQRRCMLEQAIGKHFAVFMQQIRDSEPASDIAFVLQSMTSLASSYADDLSTMSSPEAAESAGQLVEAVRRISKSGPSAPGSDLDGVADILADLGIEIPDVSETAANPSDGAGGGRSRAANQ